MSDPKITVRWLRAGFDRADDALPFRATIEHRGAVHEADGMTESDALILAAAFWYAAQNGGVTLTVTRG